jgi:hypothetical protein
MLHAAHDLLLPRLMRGEIAVQALAVISPGWFDKPSM